MMNKADIEKIVNSALENCTVSDYPSVCVSRTKFGVSVYIQNSSKKMRFSDHSVTNFDRMYNEEHFSLSEIHQSDEIIRKLFSDDFMTLKLKNGDSVINFHRQIKKSEINDWKAAKIYYKEVIEAAVRIEDLKNKIVLKEKRLTKKKDKMICDIEVVKSSFGAYNAKTGEIDRTRFSAESFEIEIKKV